jgi:hypothetical protein
MSPRRSRAAGQSRQQIAQRLRDRRAHEETLILQAADALARRNAAEVAVAEAVEALTAALDELQRHGFEPNEIAKLLDVDPSEIGGAASSRRSGGRTSRPGSASDPSQSDDVSSLDSAI